MLSLAPRMRPEEVDEVRASDGFTPVEALLDGYLHSKVCRAALFDGETAAVWGVASVTGAGRRLGGVWLLTSDLIERHPKTFWKACRGELARLLEDWDVLTNAIDARHVKAVRWARRLGFVLEEAKPFGVEGRRFHRFIVRKEDLDHV